MTAVASLPVPGSQPEILAPIPNSVEEIDRELRVAASAYRKTFARLAYWSFRFFLCEGWTTRGFEAGSAGENAYREQVLHIPRSTYMKARRVGQVLNAIPLEELEMIRTTNLLALLDVNPVIQHDFPWLKEAKMLQPVRFAELVAERNRAAGDDRDPLVSYSVRLPALAKESIEAMLESFRKRHGLTSPGRALELLIADRYDRPSLLGAVDQARELLAGVEKSRQQYGKLTDEAATWLQLAKEVLDEASAQAISAAGQESAGDEADAGRVE